jgi:LysR family glycine cleavage system transcriptional activator
MLNKSGRSSLVHLNALRAFEAAARQLSFAAAASELNVTPSAISQQIRTLEEYLDTPLFVRSKVGITLTPQARDAYPAIREGLEQLTIGLERLRSSQHDRLVTLTAPPSLAAQWLLPRIDRFRAQHPDLDIRLDASDRLADFAAEGIDIGVRYGLGGYAGLEADKLFEEQVVPVCSPKLLPLAEPADRHWLARMTLIHDSTSEFDPTFPTWSQWLRARGMENVDATRGMRMNSTLLAIQAAIDGHGIALARTIIAERDVRAGRLVTPLSQAERTRCAYYVVYLPNALAQRKVQAVRDWLFTEAGIEPPT